MKKNAVVAISVCVGAMLLAGVGVLATSMLNSPEARAVFSNKSNFSEKMSPIVLDAKTGEAIAGAKIVIVEAKIEVFTDESGAVAIDLPGNPDTGFELIFPKPWSEYTVLVFRDGYDNCALFSVAVPENGSREGPTVLMFKTEQGKAAATFCLTESPNRLWLDALVNRYK